MPETGVTILHVDDNETNRYILSRTLQNVGFTVLEAATGAAGLAAVAQFQPDLVVLDVKLPDCSGFEVCRQIKANPKTASIPVLHLSASFVQSQDKAEGLDSGADAYLAQPVEPIELVATVRSLLRIKRAEETALASARQWQITFDSINDSVCLLDQDGKTLRCNQAMMRLLGRPACEILGSAHQELMNAELGVREGSCFRSAKETHQRQVLELQFNGRWFAKTIDPVLDEQGNFTGAVLILSDITDRKQAEALLRDQNDRLNRLMISLQDQTEQARQANRIKDEFLAVLSHELRSPLNPILGWARLLQTGNLDAAKTAQAITTIERNAKLQAELIEDLLDVSRILQGKLGLNVGPVNLVTTIQAAIETIRLAAEAKSIHLRFQVNDEINNGENHGVNEQENDQPENYAFPHFPLPIPPPPHSPSFQIMGDSTRLQQIVWNLLSNAVKFTPQGGQVTVQLKQIGSGDLETGEYQNHSLLPPPSTPTYAQITVSDSGKGISPDFLPYIFECFRQEDSKTTRKFGGLGLGLAIVSHLVELHGGTVRASSPGEGQGTTFTVNLPLLRTEHRGLWTEYLANTQPSAFSAPLAGLHSLVVDDEPDSRDFVAFVLEQAGASVTTATTASEALGLLSCSQPDILLSDIGMPEMDGYALIRQVRALPPDQGGRIIAIALTAYAGEINQQQARAAGFQEHIAKPVEPEKLVKAILLLTGRDVNPASKNLAF